MLFAKQWANVAFIITVGAAVEASDNGAGGSWGKGACPEDGSLKRQMAATNAHCKASQWDLIYGCASELPPRPRVCCMDEYSLPLALSASIAESSERS